jgi:hypothetical protein
MATFNIMEPFDIDRGELDGLRPQECFVLGVEWQMIAMLADKGKEFKKLMHPKNQARIEALLNRRGLEYRIEILNENWLQLNVAAM